MAKYTFLVLAQEVLLRHDKAMSSQEIWDDAVAHGDDKKLSSQGQTPWASLNARLLVDYRDNPSSPFDRVSTQPARYTIKDKPKSQAAVNLSNKDLVSDALSPDLDATESIQSLVPVKTTKYAYEERDLHPFVVRLVRTHFGGAYCKTIFHEVSSKKDFAEWLHPDLVGFWFPFDNYSKELLALSGGGLSIAKFYSFELKRELNFGNLRKSFFQAVSNSSWAHEGYLVAANVDESEEHQAELSRLSGSFGIGVINLNLDDPQAAGQVLFPARTKESIDWDGANKLAKVNPDFRKFLTDVRIDISHALPHPTEFDPLPTLDELATLWAGWNKKATS
ncbi:HTH domain-containing protein [Ottowia sp.]|uniref:HTH domain-containing protein n=1 Tax=Ottowia sp. TaxID=1898956 RepID=UPI002CBA998D|nr:HTH domain-containing protein [Ottowia sp.]